MILLICWPRPTAFQKEHRQGLVCNQGFGGCDAYHVAPIYFGFGVPPMWTMPARCYMNTPEALKGAAVAGRLQQGLAEGEQPRYLQGHAEGRQGRHVVDRPVGDRRL